MQIRHALFGLTVALVLSATGPVHAQSKQTVSLIGANVVLPIPSGYCAMTNSNAADAQLISLIERVNNGRNKLLLMFADCAQLKMFRTSGKDLSNYGSYLAPVSANRPVKIPRAHFAKIIGKQFEKQKKMIEKAMKEAEQRVRNNAPGLDLQKNENLGLIHRDDTAAFTGVIQSWQTEGSAASRLATVTGLTLVRDRVVSLNLAAPYADKGNDHGPAGFAAGKTSTR